MAQYLNVHPDNPQSRQLVQAVAALQAGGVIALPTDASYVLACLTGDKRAMERLRLIRAVDERHHFTLMCRDLSEIGQFARVDNACYRLLKAATPGAYTFILEGTRELPRRILHPKRKTIGLRVPAHTVTQALLEQLAEPLLSTTLQLPGDEFPLTDGWDIQERMDGVLDLIVDAGHCGVETTTVIDLTGSVPEVIRAGKGPLVPLGLGTP